MVSAKYKPQPAIHKKKYGKKWAAFCSPGSKNGFVKKEPGGNPHFWDLSGICLGFAWDLPGIYLGFG
jgi:hypothetical protein